MTEKEVFIVFRQPTTGNSIICRFKETKGVGGGILAPPHFEFGGEIYLSAGRATNDKSLAIELSEKEGIPIIEVPESKTIRALKYSLDGIH
jgi:hypothetical protein